MSLASLWDQAYDSVKQEKMELLFEYEHLLSRVLIEAEANPSLTLVHEEDTKQIKNQIPQDDAATRREKMKQIATLGLNHMADRQARVTILGHMIYKQDKSAKVSEAVLWAQNHVRSAMKEESYPPAVIAGITLVLPFLKSRAAASVASQEALTYIMSQMRYYTRMGSLLLSEDINVALKNDLKEDVKDFYALITDFQVQNIMRLYHSRTNYYPNDGDWADHQQYRLNEAETSFRKSFEDVLSNKSLRQLKKMAREAEGSHKTLNKIFKTQRLLNKLSQAEVRLCPGFLYQAYKDRGIRVTPNIVYHDSKLTTSTFGYDFTVWDNSKEESLQTLEGHSDWVCSVVFSHDLKLIASASADSTVKVWDFNSGQCLQTLEGHSWQVQSVVFSHDSKLLASASKDKTVKVWGSGSGQCLHTFEGHSSHVRSVVFSHDSKLIASASSDKTVKLWDASSGKCLHTFKGHSDSIRSVVFSHDSKLLASASNDRLPYIMSEEMLIDPGSDFHTVKVWSVNSKKCLQTLSFCGDFGAHSVTWSSVFGSAFRLADTFCRSRVLLAGDAAHQFLPAGGQGMNLGIQDATSLAWKLALAASGKLSPDTADRLLDTYNRERLPAAQETVPNTMA